MRALPLAILAASAIAGAATYESCRPQQATCNMECVSINVPNTVTLLLRDCPAKSASEWGRMANLDTVPAVKDTVPAWPKK